MREILFRGRPKDEYVYKYPNFDFENGFIYGSLVVLQDKYYICTNAQVMVNSFISNTTATMIEVIPETVGQYTGFTDKNGKKIFEGDIVKICLSGKPAFGVVEYMKTGICAFVSMSRSIESNYVLDKSENFEIIGNIYDNPELLKNEPVGNFDKLEVEK